MPRAARLLPKLTVLAGSLLLVFALGEIGVRAWEAWGPASGKNPTGSGESWIIPDPDLGYRLRPSVGSQNADGLVGPP